MKVAKEKLEEQTALKSRNVISSTQLAQTKAEVQLLEAELKKLQSVRVLHEQNLARLLAVEQHGAAEAPAAAPQERLGLEPQRKLLYAGKTFEQWAEQLRTDLSPESRTEAITALGVLGAHGMGREAASAIVAAALEGIHIKPDPDWQQASSASLALQKLPVESVLPCAKTLLSSDNPFDRLFGIQIVRHMRLESGQKAELLTKALNDADDQVSQAALTACLNVAPDTPELLKKLKEMLASPDEQQVVLALTTLQQDFNNTLRLIYPDNRDQRIVRGTQQLFTDLMPEVLRAIERGPEATKAALTLLRSCGRAAKPGLENALHSDDLVVVERAGAALNLNSNDPAVRKRAESILKKAGDPTSSDGTNPPQPDADAADSDPHNINPMPAEKPNPFRLIDPRSQSRPNPTPEEVKN